jgi:hypothetical protein
MTKYLAAMAAVVTLSGIPGFASADEPATTQPVKLTDAELDEVTAGWRGPFINISLNNVTFVVNIQNSPVNIALILQLNILGTAIQNATVTAIQIVR